MTTVVKVTKYTLRYQIPLLPLLPRGTYAMVHNLAPPTEYTSCRTKKPALFHTKLPTPLFNRQPESCIVCRGTMDLKHSKLQLWCSIYFMLICSSFSLLLYSINNIPSTISQATRLLTKRSGKGR